MIKKTKPDALTDAQIDVAYYDKANRELKEALEKAQGQAAAHAMRSDRLKHENAVLRGEIKGLRWALKGELEREYDPEVPF